MSVQLGLQLIQTAAVVIGVVFGLIQLRQIRIQREIQAGIELLHPLQAPESAKALLLIHNLPNDLTENELRNRLGDDFGSVIAVLGLFESLGPLVARGHVPIEMYADLYRGATLVSWRKLRRYIEEERESGWPSLFEWVQWLAERLEERAPLASQVPAYERFSDWSESGDFDRLAGSNAQATH